MLIRTNVTNIGDPFILPAGDGYVMYATTFGAPGFRCYQSQDLQSWTDGGLVLELSDSWACRDFWAPEVIRRPGDGKYVMHFTARRRADQSLRIGVAVADSPYGPFVQPIDEPMFDFGYAAIDGHAFVDEDGTAWMYYSRDCSENVIDGIHTSEIYTVAISPDLTRVIGEPKRLTTPTQPYEYKVNDQWRWNEGPAVLKKDGKYWLFYSSNPYFSRHYCVNLAVADCPDGPFVKYHDQNPVLHCAMLPDDFSGPGHNSFFTDREGKLRSAFHIHTDENNPCDNRKAVIADIVFQEGIWQFDL